MRSHTESFICELPLRLSGHDKRVLSVRFDTARQAYNACLAESPRRLDLLRQSRAYQEAWPCPRVRKARKLGRSAPPPSTGRTSRPASGNTTCTRGPWRTLPTSG